MEQLRQVIAINFHFSPQDLGNRIFARDRHDPSARFMQVFRTRFRARGFELVTLDMVDFRDPCVKYVLYVDASWREVLKDPYLRTIPREKRALAIFEPSNINPSLYFTSLLRAQFQTVFTWDLDLLRRHPTYVRINVPAGAALIHRVNRFGGISFGAKKLLVAINTNRWSYMPHSNYDLRIKAFRHFEETLPDQFDLYGIGWNAPRIFYEKWLGYHRFTSFRSPVEDKIQTMSAYRFSLCIENNALQPGYISEKIIDSFCARCVPVYYGWRGVGDYIPRDAWIDLRGFRNLKELGAFLQGMDERQYQRYVDAIEHFMHSPELAFFSTDHLLDVITDRLCSAVRPTGC